MDKSELLPPIHPREILIEWLEDLEDSQVARDALAQLSAAGNLEKASWLRWEEIRDEP